MTLNAMPVPGHTDGYRKELILGACRRYGAALLRVQLRLFRRAGQALDTFNGPQDTGELCGLVASFSNAWT